MAELVATVAEHRAALARDVAAAVLRRPASKCSELLKNWSKRGVLALQSRSLLKRPGGGRPPFIVAGIADVDAIVQLCGDARDCPAGAVEAFNSEVRPALAAAGMPMPLASNPTSFTCSHVATLAPSLLHKPPPAAQCVQHQRQTTPPPQPNPALHF